MPRKNQHRKHKLAAKAAPAAAGASLAATTISAASIAEVSEDLGAPSVPIRTVHDIALSIGALPAWRDYAGTGHVGFLRTTDSGWYMGYSGAIDGALDSAIETILKGSNYSIMTKLHTPVIDAFVRVTSALEGERKSRGGDTSQGLNLGCAEKKLFSFLQRAHFEYEPGSLMVYRVSGDTAEEATPCASCALCIAKYLDLWAEQERLRKADKQAEEQRKKEAAEGWKVATGRRRGH